MAKGKKEKVSFLGFDPVETPDEVINTDTNAERKEAFKDAYKKVMTIIPEYFMTQKKKRKNAGGSRWLFSKYSYHSRKCKSRNYG